MICDVQTGVGVTYSFKNTRTMIAGLDSVQESREMIEGGSGFYGILRASELVPYDSAIFISTDKIPQDISLMKNAATILLKKRIRVSEQGDQRPFQWFKTKRILLLFFVSSHHSYT